MPTSDPVAPPRAGRTLRRLRLAWTRQARSGTVRKLAVLAGAGALGTLARVAVGDAFHTPAIEAGMVGLAVFGAVGTLARYGLMGAVQQRIGGEFPWGTLAVNVLGCLLFALVVAGEHAGLVAAGLAAGLLKGFCGAFTTFSTFAFESAAMLRERQPRRLVANLVAHNLVGLALIAAVLALAEPAPAAAPPFPWGTLAVNLAGCLAFGFIWALAADRGLIRVQTRVIWLTGFMGAFTTLSSLSFETQQLLAGGAWPAAAANLVAQNVLGLGLVLVGAALARAL